MGLELLIAESDVNQSRRFVNSKYDPMLYVELKNLNSSVIKHSNESVSLIKSISYDTTVLYNAISTKLKSKEFGVSSERNRRKISVGLTSYVVSENLGGYLKNVRPTEFVSSSDSDLLTNIVSGNINYVERGLSTAEVPHLMRQFYSGIVIQSNNKLRANNIKIHNSKIIISGKEYCVDLEKQVINSNNQNRASENSYSRDEVYDSFKVPLTIISKQEDVNFNMIIGNSDVKKDLFKSIRDLLQYDNIADFNPRHKLNMFNYAYLLKGPPGTGKTMMNQYAMTVARKIANELGISPPKNVKFNTKTALQSGPSGQLQSQLRSIENSKETYIIFIDELSESFGNRNKETNSQEEDKCTVELLDFLDGSSYINKGNYLFLSATNFSKKIDEALLSRLSGATYTLWGPSNKEERYQLLEMKLKPQIENGTLEIRDKNRILSALENDQITGRHLKLVSNKLVSKSTDYDHMQTKGLSAEQKLKFHQNIGTKMTEIDLIKTLNEVVNKNEKY